MKNKNWFLALIPVFALVVILYRGEFTPVRIVCAVIAAVLFVAYIVLLIMKNKPSKGK